MENDVNLPSPNVENRNPAVIFSWGNLYFNGNRICRLRATLAVLICGKENYDFEIPTFEAFVLIDDFKKMKITALLTVNYIDRWTAS